MVREQITRALDSHPPTLDAFRNKLGSLTYAEITDLWQQERNTREKFESRSRPIMELREQIAPEIQNLIQQRGRRCRDLQQQIKPPRGGEHPLHLGNRLEPGQDIGLGARLHRQQHGEGLVHLPAMANCST